MGQALSAGCWQCAWALDLCSVNLGVWPRCALRQLPGALMPRALDSPLPARFKHVSVDLWPSQPTSLLAAKKQKMAQSEAAGVGAVQSLLALLTELGSRKEACLAHELSAFTAGPGLRQRAAVARAELLARFLRLESSNGAGSSSSTPTPQAASRGHDGCAGRGAAKRRLRIGDSRPLSPGRWGQKHALHAFICPCLVAPSPMALPLQCRSWELGGATPAAPCRPAAAG